jgi:molybdenum cofactor cytidylyltransferase
VVLAAGTSSRLGRPKQLLDLRGRMVLQRVLDAALAKSLDEVVVVLGHEAQRIGQAIEPNGRVRSVTNPDYLDGQSTSLRAGLRALNEACEAAVVLLGDQPGLRPETVDAVVRTWRKRGGPIVQAAYGGRPAHPTLFARAIWPEIEALTGDQGARDLIVADPSRRTPVEVGGEPPDDIDTERDYIRALSRQQNAGNG